MKERIYSYQVLQVLRASSRNRVLVAKAPYDHYSVVIFDWKRNDKAMERAKPAVHALLARVADTLSGAALFSAPKRICLSVPVPLDPQGNEDFEAARQSAESLIRDLQTQRLFTGNWSGEADHPPPDSEKNGRLPPPPRMQHKRLLIAAALLVIAIGAVFLFKGRATPPRPSVRIETFLARPSSIAPDQAVTLSWYAPAATRVELWANGVPLLTAPLPVPAGSIRHSPQLETIYELHAMGENGVEVVSESQKVSIDPHSPKP